MKHEWRKWLLVALVTALVTGAAGTAVSATHRDAHATKSAVKVGIIYSRTGGLAAFGAEYIEGFQYGLKYATNGTNTVNGTYNITGRATDSAAVVTSQSSCNMIAVTLAMVTAAVNAGSSPFSMTV